MQCVCGFNVTIYDDRNCGFGGKSARDGSADSFGASGDENDFVFEFEVDKSRRTCEKIGCSTQFHQSLRSTCHASPTIRPKKAPRKELSLMFPI